MTLSNTQLRNSFVPSIARRDRSVVSRLLSAILSQWPERTRGSPPLPNYLRRGLGRDPVDESRKYWDHQESLPCAAFGSQALPYGAAVGEVPPEAAEGVAACTIAAMTAAGLALTSAAGTRKTRTPCALSHRSR
jgi:hypothetical protein